MPACDREEKSNTFAWVALGLGVLSRVYLKYRSYQDFNNHPDVLDHWTKVNGERLFGRPRSRIVQGLDPELDSRIEETEKLVVELEAFADELKRAGHDEAAAERYTSAAKARAQIAEARGPTDRLSTLVSVMGPDALLFLERATCAASNESRSRSARSATGPRSARVARSTCST